MVQYFNPYGPIDIYLENLPHWRQEGTTYFVTFRLADSLPAATLQQWRAERHAWLAVNPEPWTRAQEQEYYRRFAQRVELWLDSGSGSCVLSLPAVQELVANALRNFDGQRYALGFFVVATNHVHAIVTPNPGVQLADILHTWKSYTAKQILKIPTAAAQLARSRSHQTNTVWQKEYYDHIVRSPAEFYNIEQYIQRHAEYVGAVSRRSLLTE
jgi:REP element-mobilizing transposase RayT